MTQSDFPLVQVEECPGFWWGEGTLAFALEIYILIPTVAHFVDIVSAAWLRLCDVQPCV